MVDKWADFLISAVRYDEKHTHIVKVRTHKDLGEKVEKDFSEELRSTVVSNLKKGKTYMTSLKNKEGKWNKGAHVEIIKINGEEYIRTDGNQTESDNLGELPEL